MRFGVLFSIILLSICFAMPALSQDDPTQRGPVTRREVRRWLTITQNNQELSDEANRELIAEIGKRGVNFALSPEEEWAFQLLEASDELILAIRSGMPTEQREATLKLNAQRKLYTAFATNRLTNNLDSQRSALEAGREFVQRFGSDPSVIEIVRLINRSLPQIERSVRLLEQASRVRRKN